MKTFLVIVATAIITWIAASVVHGVQTSTERLWLVSAVKTPGRMALGEIQADMNAGQYRLAKAKIDVFLETWQRFDSGPDSFDGRGIGDIMVAFSKLDTNNVASHPEQNGTTNGGHL
jgi:hypothetical protein